MYEFLKVTEVGEVKENATGLRYATIKFKPSMMLNNGMEIFSNEKEKSRTLFGAHDEFKSDPLFDEAAKGTLRAGALVEGTINTYDVFPYQPKGFEKPVTTFTCVVFKGEDGAKYADRQMKNNDSSVYNPNTGELMSPKQTVKSTFVDVETVTGINDLP